MSIFLTLSEQEELKTDGTMRRAAQLRRDLNDHERATVRLFERIKQQTGEAADARMVVDFPLSPEMSAAYEVWERTTNRDTAYLSEAESVVASMKAHRQSWEVGEAPIGPDEAA